MTKFGETTTECDIAEFELSRWFTRGWTLQELVASSVLVFFNSKWEPIATKGYYHRMPELLSIRNILYKITGISKHCLDDGDQIHGVDIGSRMGWAAYRSTTRKEDKAYCLLGLLDTNMPLLYGEGEKAFLRLQEELMKNSEDKSFLAWGLDEDVQWLTTEGCSRQLRTTSPGSTRSEHFALRTAASSLRIGFTTPHRP